MRALYSLCRQGSDALRQAFQVDRGEAGNVPELLGIYSKMRACVVHLREGERTLSMMRWGLPSPAFILKGRSTPASPS